MDITDEVDNYYERQYLNMLKDVLMNGSVKKSRNSEVLSKLGYMLTFNITNSFPLLTTKKVFLKGVIEELLWFLKGSTDSTILAEKGIHIWDGNSSREFLDSIGLDDYREGDCGPIYGFQWRHYNAEYTGPDSDYQGKGIDQLGNIIKEIRENPTSRRLYMTAWNPCQLTEMVLPPCHVSYQFYVDLYEGKKYLSCMMYQRSGDLFLGVPFNIASTALLTYLVAKQTDTIPKEISIVIGDAHIYRDHVEQVKEQLSRTPYSFPQLSIINNRENIEDYVYEDFKLENYRSHPPIKAKMIP